MASFRTVQQLSESATGWDSYVPLRSDERGQPAKPEKVGADDPMAMVRRAEALRACGDDASASSLFLQAAQVFEAAGAGARALALYKLVANSRIRPETSLMLAGCFERLGAAEEARSQLERAAEACEEAHEPDLAAELRRCTAQLDPSDVQARLRLAEYYLDRDRVPEAVEMLRSALGILQAAKAWQEAAILAKKILSLVPDDRGLVNWTVRILLAAGERAQAMGILRQHLETKVPEAVVVNRLAHWAAERPRSKASLQLLATAASNYLREGDDPTAIASSHRILALWAAARTGPTQAPDGPAVPAPGPELSELGHAVGALPKVDPQALVADLRL